jgi:RNA polymerase sigma-70 factor (ECF subfamily)
MSNEDFELVKRAQQGEPAAFETIYEKYQPSIYTFFFYRLNDVDRAEDMTAEVFVRLVEKVDSFKDQGRPLLAWLYTIARNLLIDHYRGNGHEELPLQEDLVSSDYDGPHAVTERRLARRCLASAFRQLTGLQQLVILLKFMEGRSNAEIADVLGNTEGAVKSLQHRALASLRRMLDKERCYER